MSGRHRNRGGLIPGLILIAVGTAFLLERFDFLSLRQVWQYWPMIVVVIGLGNLLKPEGGRRSIFLLLIGVWLQINVLGLWGLDFGDSWPLLIIFVGASFIFDSLASSTGYGGGRPRGGSASPTGGIGSESSGVDPRFDGSVSPPADADAQGGNDHEV